MDTSNTVIDQSTLGISLDGSIIRESEKLSRPPLCNELNGLVYSGLTGYMLPRFPLQRIRQLIANH